MPLRQPETPVGASSFPRACLSSSCKGAAAPPNMLRQRVTQLALLEVFATLMLMSELLAGRCYYALVVLHC